MPRERSHLKAESTHLLRFQPRRLDIVRDQHIPIPHRQNTSHSLHRRQGHETTPTARVPGKVALLRHQYSVQFLFPQKFPHPLPLDSDLLLARHLTPLFNNEQ